MRGKELLTAGLATVATIHAAHGVYSSMEAHERRHKLVQEGEMSPAEARKKQTKAWVQDAAAVGIAALGIKGAFSEWKEMNEHRFVDMIVIPKKLTNYLPTDARFTSWRRERLSSRNAAKNWTERHAVHKKRASTECFPFCSNNNSCSSSNSSTELLKRPCSLEIR
jgi:hypothetical protein